MALKETLMPISETPTILIGTIRTKRTNLYNVEPKKMGKSRDIDIASTLKGDPKVAAEFVATGVDNVRLDGAAEAIINALKSSAELAAKASRNTQAEMVKVAGTTPTSEPSINKAIGEASKKAVNDTVHPLIIQNEQAIKIQQELLKTVASQTPHVAPANAEALKSQLSSMRAQLEESIGKCQVVNQGLKAALKSASTPAATKEQVSPDQNAERRSGPGNS